MKISNPFKLLQKLDRKPPFVSGESVNKHLSKEDRDLLQKIGITASQLFEKMHVDTEVLYDRTRFYNEVNHALDHWMIGPAMELYADYATNYNQIHGASVWITSENPIYQRMLSKLLDDVGIEERIFDWGWTIGSYGDLFVKLDGQPGLGITSIDDHDHPINTSRIDVNGALVGFYKTPQGTTQGGNSQELIPPWEYVHFRLLGAKKKRTVYGDPNYSEFQTSYLMTGSSNRQVSSKYGTSLLINAIAPYKRLRLAEDSLLMARLTRGIIRYVWKLKVDSGNAESVNELITQVVGMLKKARALNTSATDPNFDSKFGPLSSVEDILIPVWGDVGDLDYSKIGEDADIRWIADVDNLRDQLACALRVPLSVLGGYVQEASGQLGSQAIEKLSVEFAHSARRLQRALKAGIKRICQVHLAYMDMDPDPRLFEVNMSETSTAEEESLRESMDAGVDVIDKMVELAVKADPTVDKVGLVNYFNQKLLKLEDFDLKDFHQSDIADEFDVNGELLPMEEPTPGARMPETPEVGIPEEEVEVPESVYHPIRGSDLMSFLPGGGTRASSVLNERFEANWKSTYEGTKISTEDLSEKSEEPKSGEPLNG